MLKVSVRKNPKHYTYAYSVMYKYGILSQHRTKEAAKRAAEEAEKKYKNAHEAFMKG